MFHMTFAAKLHQRGLPAAVPGGAAGEAAAAGPDDPDPAVDVRAVVQGAALRHPPHLHALLHLRHHRHAGHCHCIRPT